MPEQKSLITENVMDKLSNLLGAKIEYYSDGGQWEEVYLSGFDSYSPPSIEVFPPSDTVWGKRWHLQNDKIPFPFPGHDARIKVDDPERLRLIAIDAGQTKRIS